MTDTITKCTCGRTFTHCKVCGYRTVYKKKMRSLEVSRELGTNVAVFSCQRCGNETNTLDECKALPYGDVVERTPFNLQQVNDQRPQKVLDHFTLEYIEAFNAKYTEMASSGKYRSESEIYEAMQSDGWTVHPEGSVINPLTKRVERPVKAISMPKDEPQGAQELSLDDVIEKMKKEAQ